MHLETVKEEYDYAWDQMGPPKPSLRDQYKSSPLQKHHPSYYWRHIPKEVIKKIYMVRTIFSNLKFPMDFQLDFEIGILNWIFKLEVQMEFFPNVITKLDFQIGFPSVSTKLDFHIGFPSVSTKLDFQMGFSNVITKFDFKLHFQIGVSLRFGIFKLEFK